MGGMWLGESYPQSSSTDTIEMNGGGIRLLPRQSVLQVLSGHNVDLPQQNKGFSTHNPPPPGNFAVSN